MAISSIAAARLQAPSQQAAQSVAPHQHGHQRRSIADVDAAGSSVAAAPSASGQVGRKLDLIA